MTKWTIAILLITTAAVAQQTHNQYEPPNAVGAGQKLLAQFVGEWDVVKTFFPMTGQPIVTKATSTQYMIQDGKFLQSDFTFFNSDGTKTTGTGISGLIRKRIASQRCGTTRGKRQCRFVRATARSTARTSSFGPRPLILIVPGVRPSRARTLSKTPPSPSSPLPDRRQRQRADDDRTADDAQVVSRLRSGSGGSIAQIFRQADVGSRGSLRVMTSLEFFQL
jgi:hypothetical protein